MATIQLNLNKRQFVGLVRSMSEEDRLELYRELRRSLFVSRFDRLLESLRTDELTMDEITREVESVRQQRYEITDFVANLGTDLGLPADFDEKEAYRKHLEEKHLPENASGPNA